MFTNTTLKFKIKLTAQTNKSRKQYTTSSSPAHHNTPQVYHSTPQVHHNTPQVYHSTPQVSSNKDYHAIMDACMFVVML